MTAESWATIKRIVGDALERAPETRDAFLVAACANDAELRREVESLLRFADSDALEQIAAPLARVQFADSDLIGKLVGNYRIVREIGAGGMGAVYEAVRADGEFERRVAVKLVGRATARPDLLRRFQDERQILAGLEHPFIASLFDGGTFDANVPYFVLEYVEGVPVTEFVKTRNLGETERLQLFRKICAAVEYAHARLIVHRDLKPSNILVATDGTPKLLDFGIAKAVAQNESEAGWQAVTPEYASPEQLRREPVTTATDIYSLGVVLHELLTGKRPNAIADCGLRIADFKNDKIRGETIENNDSKSIPQSAIRNPQLNADLRAIICKALEPDARRRYSSVERFSDDIDRYLRGLTVRARRKTVVYSARKFLRRYPVSSAAVLIAVLSLVGGIVATSAQAVVAERERRRAEDRLNDVRQLANSFLFEINDAINELPGAIKARRLMVERALAYLDKSAREAAGDVGLQRELAIAYLKVGDVQGKPNAQNLGDTAGALESYGKAAAILEELNRIDPNDCANRRDLSLAYESLGLVQRVTKDYNSALATHRKSLTMRESLLAAEPHNREYQALVANALLRVGDSLGARSSVNGTTDSLAEQLENYEKSLAMHKALAQAEPDNQLEQRLTAVLHQRIGSSSEQIGKISRDETDFRRALDNHRAALQIWAQANPADARGRFPAGQHKHIGSVQLKLNDVGGALESFAQAVAMLENLAANDAGNAEYDRELMYVYTEFAGANRAAENSLAAQKYYRRALGIAERLTAADAARVTDNYRILTENYSALGELLEAANDKKQAVENYRRAVEYTEKWLEIAPDNNRLRADLERLKTKSARLSEK